MKVILLKDLKLPSGRVLKAGVEYELYNGRKLVDSGVAHEPGKKPKEKKTKIKEE